eukprot:5198197-Pleurochrysis_carterae.AAC.1
MHQDLKRKLEEGWYIRPPINPSRLQSRSDSKRPALGRPVQPIDAPTSTSRPLGECPIETRG